MTILHAIQRWDCGDGEKPVCGAIEPSHLAKTCHYTEATNVNGEHGWHGHAICIDCVRMPFVLYNAGNASCSPVPGRDLDKWLTEMQRRFGTTFVAVPIRNANIYRGPVGNGGLTPFPDED